MRNGIFCSHSSPTDAARVTAAYTLLHPYTKIYVGGAVLATILLVAKLFDVGVGGECGRVIKEKHLVIFRHINDFLV